MTYNQQGHEFNLSWFNRNGATVFRLETTNSRCINLSMTEAEALRLRDAVNDCLDRFEAHRIRHLKRTANAGGQ
ncbi:hypothetical protein [Rhodococcus sp. MTM3W5.2]|uniref:hypothetical protein n=1 Tax=Rhodococcus sp. MTM3W5.2 TaxID=1805827 RepID=UPI00097C1AC4|nr:hypothetical protein [Rhodococcus sp. MTM3W5.2]